MSYITDFKLDRQEIRVGDAIIQIGKESGSWVKIYIKAPPHVKIEKIWLDDGQDDGDKN